MPELPEVETVRSGLEDLLCGKKIKRVKLARKDLRTPIPQKLTRVLNGLKVKRVVRRAKYLLIEVDDWIILSHLGMTGTWRLLNDDQNIKVHDHCFIYLESGQCVVFNDPRRFGVLEIYRHNQMARCRWLSHLGPEPLDATNFTAVYLKQKCQRRSANIKTVLMDQKVVVGVGNIYASEALFRAGIRPTTSANKLSILRLERLVEAIRRTLKEALQAGGTTLRDFRQAGGETGYFQTQLLVYGRQGEGCQQCSSPIKAQVLGGRSTFWCPKCQK